jgi:hypothetical protein
VSYKIAWGIGPQNKTKDYIFMVCGVEDVMKDSFENRIAGISFYEENECSKVSG